MNERIEVSQEDFERSIGRTLNETATRARAGNRPDIVMDKYLTRHVHAAMDFRLQLARDDDRGGWWDAQQCTDEALIDGLVSCIGRGDDLDALNYAAMIFARRCMDKARQQTEAKEEVATDGS